MTISNENPIIETNLPAPVSPSKLARALINTLLSSAGFAACIIIPARPWTSPRPWIMAATFLIAHFMGTIRIYRANPDLLRERARLGSHPGQPIADKLLLLAFLATYTVLLIVSSADGSRWHIWPAPPIAISWLGLAIFIAGWWLALRALETNAFAVRVVRHQPERGHRVIDTGVYSIVRHPMYAGLVAVIIGIPLWLGSTLGLLLSAAPIATLMLRIVVEERVLRQSVPGYPQYTQRVRSRLIPGIW
jgi:protein-S-isoprenylcysteine O-methyltransferase Ste14